jgi:hypothetical protein
MDSSEVRVEVVVIQHPLWATGKGQLRSPFTVTKLDRAAALLAAQHGDQAGGQLPLPDGLVDELFLGMLALKIMVGRIRLGGCRLGVLDQLLRQRLQLRKEVLAADAQPIHKLVELLVPSKRQIPLEDQAVHTVQCRYNRSGELRPKPLGVSHGVLLPEGFNSPSSKEQNASYFHPLGLRPMGRVKSSPAHNTPSWEPP